MAKWQALIVEDDLPSCEMLAYLLQYHNIEVDIAMNAEQAMLRLGKKSYTCAIIDLSLPGMNGWALLNHIKDDPNTRYLKCIAVTAYYDPKVGHEATQAGFVACFGKPLHAASFVQQLESVLL